MPSVEMGKLQVAYLGRKDQELSLEHVELERLVSIQVATSSGELNKLAWNLGGAPDLEIGIWALLTCR